MAIARGERNDELENNMRRESEKKPPTVRIEPAATCPVEVQSALTTRPSLRVLSSIIS